MNTHFRVMSIKQNINFIWLSFGNFVNKIKVKFWITNEVLYEIDTHIEYLKLKF